MSNKPQKSKAAINKLDGRRAETQLYRLVLDDLIANLGPNVSPYRHAIAEAAAGLAVQLRKLQVQMLSGQLTTETDAKAFLSGTASLLRALGQLGLPADGRIVAEDYCGEALVLGEQLTGALVPEGLA